MKKIIIFMLVGFFVTSCGYKLMKKEDIKPTKKTEVKVVDKQKTSDELVIKTGSKRTEMVILQELLSNGEIIDRDVYVKKTFEKNSSGIYKPVVSTTEFWIIKTGDDFHVAIFEQGILMEVKPVKDLESAHKMLKPYGEWNK